MKTFAATVVTAACVSAPGAATENLSLVFAECVGRLSAETEHAWLMGDAGATDFEHQRHTFLSLLDAATPQRQMRQVLSYRIEVKLAHSSLLTLATFGTDTAQATRADRLAKSHVASCQRMLLNI